MSCRVSCPLQRRWKRTYHSSDSGEKCLPLYADCVHNAIGDAIVKIDRGLRLRLDFAVVSVGNGSGHPFLWRLANCAPLHNNNAKHFT
jgi:hypothetical protein